MNSEPIDVTFDVRSDSNGRDPDKYSPTLRRYHRQLWSKELPNGAVFELTDEWPKGYLKHSSELGTFWLSSDTILRTFGNHLKMRPIVEQVPEGEREEFWRRGYTIGGTIVFPGNKIGNKRTINHARGMDHHIQDRFDLTLECIRRHYVGGDSPLSEVIARYADFFALFESFTGYVDFFHLHDLVTEDYTAVRFFLPFAEFRVTQALPQNLAEYEVFRAAMLKFIDARNARIAAATA